MDWLPDHVIDHLRESLDAPDLSGTPYVLGRELGRGGMGTVYEARDTRLERTVALKALSPLDDAAEAVERLWREARVLARLEHPGIVPIHDVGVLPDGRPYYVMKRVEDRRLDEYLQARPPIAGLPAANCLRARTPGAAIYRRARHRVRSAAPLSDSGRDGRRRGAIPRPPPGFSASRELGRAPGAYPDAAQDAGASDRGLPADARGAFIFCARLKKAHRTRNRILE